MSKRQVESCAARLPAAERAWFTQTLEEAGMMISKGVRLRRAAWALYRSRLLEQVGELAACGLDESEIASRLGLTAAVLRRLLDRAARER